MASNYSVANLGITISSTARGAILSINSLTKAVERANVQTAKLSADFVKMGGVLTPTTAKITAQSSSLKSLESNLTKSTNALQKMSGTFSGLGRIISTNLGFGSLQQSLNTITTGLNKIINEVSGYIENFNLFNVTITNSLRTQYKEETKITEEFNKQLQFQYLMNDVLKTNMSETMRYQGFFQNLSGSLGLSSDSSILLSQNLTKLSYDLSSLFNIPVATAFSKISSGLIGQTKPLRNLGIDVTQQTLQPILYSLGINKQVTSLTQAEKVMLRYISILRQSTNAQGDFARTIEAPANQIRILTNQIKELSRWVGAIFIGTFGKIIPYVNAFVMVLKEMAKWVAYAFGFNLNNYNFIGQQAEDVGTLDEELNNATESANALKRTLRSFDEINNISTGASTSVNGIAIGNDSGAFDKLKDVMSSYDNLMSNVSTKAGQISDKILTWLGFSKTVNEQTGEISWFFTQIVGLDFSGLSKDFGLLADKLSALGSTLWDSLIDLYDHFLKPLGAYIINVALPDFLETVGDGVEAIGKFYKNNKEYMTLFYDKFLLPVSKILLDAFNKSFEGFVAVIDSMTSNEAGAKRIFDLIIVFLAALTATKLILALKTHPFIALSVAILTIIGSKDDFSSWLESLGKMGTYVGTLITLTAALMGVAFAIAAVMGASTAGISLVAWTAALVAAGATYELWQKKLKTPNPPPKIPLPPGGGTNNPTPKIPLPPGGGTIWADGGFPTTGELFIAREAGPEMVGSMGGKTAVANNDQIVSGITQGVFAGVVNAFSGIGSNSPQTINLTVQIGSNKVGDGIIDLVNDSISRGKTILI